MKRIESAANPLVKTLRVLSSQPNAYRKQGLVLLEGEHLCDAWNKAARGRPRVVVLSEAFWALGEAAWTSWVKPGDELCVLPDKLMASVSSLDSSPQVMYLVPPHPLGLGDLEATPTVALDRLQDPGNVGSILRSAAAFGVQQVVALKGTAALWSPKVLRAGQGAHFALRLVEADSAASLERLQNLGLTLVATSPHAIDRLGAARLPQPVAWVFGHEGQGVDAAWLAQAQTLAIPQAGQESLNVAAAAAICLHQQFVWAAQPRLRGRA